MEGTLQFVVTGDKGEDYRVTFSRKGLNFTGKCTCESGKMELYCNHVFQLLAGDTSHLVSPNAEQLDNLPAMAAGTDVAQALENLIQAEAALVATKRVVANCKTALSRALHD
jgi:uncharacterized Zn finger protein